MAKSKQNIGQTLAQFEQEHGGGRIRELTKALETVGQARRKVDLELPCSENELRFAVVGDTHFGSLYEAKDQLQAFYDRVKAEGINIVLHAGDVLDGHRLYRGQEFEIHAHGWAAQRDWFAEVAPRGEGVHTYFVTGNHDGSLKKAAGIDVGEELQHVRPDWVFFGETVGRVQFKTPSGRKYQVMLLHPDGTGSAYALSYRPQKIAEQIEGGTKPNMLVIGHYHKAEWMPSYRNISVIQSGAFQWQTPHMVGKGLAAHVGGWLVRVSVGSKESLSNAVHAEFVAFYGEGA